MRLQTNSPTCEGKTMVSLNLLIVQIFLVKLSPSKTGSVILNSIFPSQSAACKISAMTHTWLSSGMNTFPSDIRSTSGECGSQFMVHDLPSDLSVEDVDLCVLSSERRRTSPRVFEESALPEKYMDTSKTVYIFLAAFFLTQCSCCGMDQWSWFLALQFDNVACESGMKNVKVFWVDEFKNGKFYIIYSKYIQEQSTKQLELRNTKHYNIQCSEPFISTLLQRAVHRSHEVIPASDQEIRRTHHTKVPQAM